MQLRLALATVAAALVGATSCTSSPPPCSPDLACGEGACVIGKCRPVGSNVVSAGTRRIVLQAREVAVLSSRDIPPDTQVTAFGSRASGNVMVLLAFDTDIAGDVTIDGAFLVIDPEPASPGPMAPVHIEVAPIVVPWATNLVSWGRAPSMGLALADVRVPTARRAPVRVDVTEHVARERGVGHGLALLSDGADPIGARLMTMARSTTGPKLELYLKDP